MVQFADIPRESFYFLRTLKGGRREVQSLNNRYVGPVVELKLVAISRSPKGRKNFAELTDEGRMHLPAVEAFLQDRADEQKARNTEMEMRDRKRLAGPALYEALKKALPYVQDRGTPAEVEMIEAAIKLADEGGTGESL